MAQPIPIRAGMSRFYCADCKAYKCRHGSIAICHSCGSRQEITK